MNTEQVLTTEKRLMSPGVSRETQLANVVFDKASGSYLFDLEGRAYLDFGAGIFTQNVGHTHPHVVKRVQDQVARLSNVHDGNTVERAQACQALNRQLPEYLQRMAFFTTGAEAVEAAIRAVFSHAPPERQRLAALRYGFHGKSQGARSLVHWDIGYNSQSGNSVLGYAANCYRCPLERTYPSCEMQCAKLVNRHISSKGNIAALFFEPVQGAAGVIVPPAEYWPMIADACKQNGVLLVADEVVTAGGRTGHFTACEHFNIEADLMMGAKGLSSGFPFSVLAGREELLANGPFAEAGATSSTFGGNPVSCVATTATIEVIEEECLLEDVQSKATLMSQGLESLKCDHPCVGDVRGVGLLWALEFVSDLQAKTPDVAAAEYFYNACLKLGVRTCVGGNVVRLGPPLNIHDTEIKEALTIFDRVLGQWGRA